MRDEPNQGNMALDGGSSVLPSLRGIAERIGTNRTVLALLSGRIRDAIRKWLQLHAEMSGGRNPGR